MILTGLLLLHMPPNRKLELGVVVMEVGVFCSFPNPTQYCCKRVEIICERKGMSGESLDP